MKSVLTAQQAKQLNQKIGPLLEEFHALLDKHGFSNLEIHSLHLQPKIGGGHCICPGTGLPGTMVCDRATGICTCDCS